MELLLSVIIAVLITFLIINQVSSAEKKRRIEIFIPQEKKRFVERIYSFIGKQDKQDLEEKFVDAGFYNTQWAKFYLAGKVVALVLVVVTLFLSGLSNITMLVIGLLALITIIVGPDIFLSMRKKAIIAKCSRQLPYMLDMMAICVQTGMTIEAALAYLSVELKGFDRDLCHHIKITSDSAKVKGLAKALHELSERIPTNEVRSFTMMLIQNIQFGTSIAQVLSDLSEDMRKHQLLTIEEKIGKLAAKMSIPLILLIMFPIVILILAPGFMMLAKGIY